MTSSLTTALEEATINNERLGRENHILKTENDAIKDENKQLTTLLDKMAVNNENQIQQINSQSSENATIKDENKQLKTEVDMIKAENVQLKIENACHVDTSRSLHSPPVSPKRQRSKVSQWSGIT